MNFPSAVENTIEHSIVLEIPIGSSPSTNSNRHVERLQGTADVVEPLADLTDSQLIRKINENHAQRFVRKLENVLLDLNENI
jgi:hypothetical protein